MLCVVFPHAKDESMRYRSRCGSLCSGCTCVYDIKICLLRNVSILDWLGAVHVTLLKVVVGKLLVSSKIRSIWIHWNCQKRYNLITWNVIYYNDGSINKHSSSLLLLNFISMLIQIWPRHKYFAKRPSLGYMKHLTYDRTHIGMNTAESNRPTLVTVCPLFSANINHSDLSATEDYAWRRAITAVTQVVFTLTTGVKVRRNYVA